MSRTLPAIILRHLYERAVLVGLQWFTARAEAILADAQPDPVALDADEKAMFDRDDEIHIVHGDDIARPMCPAKSFRLGSKQAEYATCPDCLRVYHGEGRPS